MRNSDRADPAPCFHLRDGLLVEQGDTVPEQISVARLQQQRALANGKFGFRANPEKLRCFLFNPIAMICLQLFERGPLLTIVPDKLAFVLTNRTSRGRLRSLV